MNRTDISHFLIHFTQGDEEMAFENLKSIIRSKCIWCSDYKIRGGHRVCWFYEAPLDCIRELGGIKNEYGYSRYAAFGIMFSKKDVYNRGGRPIIYSEDVHYDLLPVELNWRFMRYEPKFIQFKGVDYSWEREWRVNGDFVFADLKFEVIVPSIEFGDRLKRDLELETIQLYKQCANDQIEYLDYSDWLANNQCIIDGTECPSPEEFDRDCIICMDKSC